MGREQSQEEERNMTMYLRGVPAPEYHKPDNGLEQQTVFWEQEVLYKTVNILTEKITSTLRYLITE